MDQELTGHAMPPIRGSSNSSIFSIFLFDFCLSLSLSRYAAFIIISSRKRREISLKQENRASDRLNKNNRTK